MGYESFRIGGKLLKHIESVAIANTDIEEKKVWLGEPYQFDRLGCGSSLSNNLDVLYLAQKLLQLLSCQNFIISEYGANHRAPTPCRRAAIAELSIRVG